jgi:hypothetical protein
MEPEESWPYLQKPASRPSSDAAELSKQAHILFIWKLF